MLDPNLPALPAKAGIQTRANRTSAFYRSGPPPARGTRVRGSDCAAHYYWRTGKARVSPLGCFAALAMTRVKENKAPFGPTGHFPQRGKILER